MKRKLISIRCYCQDQSWYFEKVVQFENPPGIFVSFKVDIRRNAYDNQSYARVYRWNGTEWKRVVDAPIMECVCKSISYVQKDVTENNFEADALRLFKEALAIVKA